MNHVQRTALLAFFLLLLMAAIGWWLGGEQARPADAEPRAVLLDLGVLETVRLLPPDQRRRYLDPDRFYAEPVKDPERGPGGRKPGGAVASAGFDSPVAASGVPRSASYRVVRVHQGETLGQIAERELGSSRRWRDLLRWNGIDNERLLEVGQELRIYDGEGDPAMARTDHGTSVGRVAEGTYHTVRAGEILGRISQMYYGTTQEVDRILAANGVTDPTRIRPGQILLIPPIE